MYQLLDPTGDSVSVIALMKEFSILCFFLLFCFRKTLSKEDTFSRDVLLNIREKSDTVLQYENLLMRIFYSLWRKHSNFLSCKYIIWSGLHNRDSVDMRAYTSQCFIIHLCFFFTMRSLEGFNVCSKSITDCLRSSIERKYTTTSETF